MFDNFETVSNPSELFRWIDTCVRGPNKLLITTRRRDFKGDYPIEVRGMSDPECERLIDSTAGRLGIRGLLTASYRAELLKESEGHPYVVKILLGEVAKAGALRKIERIVADADDMLLALFERTFDSLSPVAQRVLMTLSSWRVTVPRLAVEAVLLRPENERMSVGDAIDELERSSFVEMIESPTDHGLFISTPLVASMFGKRKLSVSPLKSSIEGDVEILQQFGAGQRGDVKHGIGPRVARLVASIATRISQSGETSLERHLPMLEYISRHHPPTWLLVATLHEELGGPANLERAKQAIRSHLESERGSQAVGSWKKLARLCGRTGDILGEVHALVEVAVHPDVQFWELSEAAGKLNFALTPSYSPPPR